MNKLIVAVLLGLTSISFAAATKEDFENKLNELETFVGNDQKQGLEVLSVLSMVAAAPQSVTVGHAGSHNSTVSLPIYYKAGPSQVSGIQFDVVLSSGLTVTSVDPGIAAQAAGKTVQGNQTQVGYRVLIFGLNQTVIPGGPIAVLNINMSNNVGKRQISLTNVSASSPSGTGVTLTSKAGSVTRL